MDFSKVLEHILGAEGGYANWSKDRGGETYKGISRVSWPKWEGWPRVDQIKASIGKNIVWKDRKANWPTLNRMAAQDQELQKQVENFYYTNFYLPVNKHGIDPYCSAKLCDIAVNTGMKNANKILQRALNISGPFNLSDDGVIGAKTRAAIEKTDPALLMKSLVTMQTKYYKDWLNGSGRAWAPQAEAFYRRARWIPS